MTKPRYAKEYKYKSSLKLVNVVILILVVFFSMLIAVNTARISNYNKETLRLSETHIKYTDIATQLNLGSEILTEQARLFVETGDKEYMDGYFEESGVTRHRDIAMAELRSLPGEYNGENVRKAMRESMQLMEREYYAMHLSARGYGIPEDELPDIVRNTELSQKDINLSPEMARRKARNMLFDDIYVGAKGKIKEGVSHFLGDMIDISETEYAKITQNLKKSMWWQSIIILMMLLLVALMTFFISRHMITPIINASKSIEENLPVEMPPFLEEMDALGQSYNNLRRHDIELMDRLKEVANTDALTGLGSRTAYNSYVDRISDKKIEILLFLFDVNKLRETNNQEGHAKGDLLLESAGRCIKNIFGIYDYENCFRVGGDEFVAFIENEPRKRANVYIDEFRKEIGKCGISVSVGYAYTENISGTSENKMFNEADENMYKDKNGEN